MKKEILAKLEQLTASLHSTENGATNFFIDARKKIDQCKTEEECNEVFKSLSTIGTIGQYGNFNDEQERLLDEMLEYLFKLLYPEIKESRQNMNHRKL